MKLIQTGWFLATCWLVAASPALAAPTPSPSQLLPPVQTDPASLKPGRWVKYSILQVRAGRAAIVRLTALEKEGKGQWVEIAVTINRRTLVIKTLFKGSPGTGQPVKTIIQPAGHQPLLLPAQHAKRQVPKLAQKRDPRAVLVSKGKVKVAAGTFVAERYRITEKGKKSEFWLSHKVPGWPMIKVVSDQLVMELAAFGKDGRSQIKGKPGKLDERLLRQLGLMK